MLKMIEAKELSLDEFLKCLFSDKYIDLYPNNHFPTDEMTDEFISKIHTFSETQIKGILRRFLIYNCTLGKDEFNAEWISNELKNKENINKILSYEYFRRVIIASKNKNFCVWEGLNWILNLLPHSPNIALQAIDAYFSANCQFLPDNWLNALSDCSTIIRARYINYSHLDDVFFSLSPTDFEKLVSKLYEEIGYNVELTKESYDNGIDIIATKKIPSQQEIILIQCKRYTKSNIGVAEIRNLLGVVANEKSTKGVLVATTQFTKEAKKLADKNPSIELIDNKELSILLNTYFGPYWTSKINKIISPNVNIEYIFEQKNT
jgi:restriction system protein